LTLFLIEGKVKKLRIYLDNCCFNRPYDDQEAEDIKRLSIDNKDALHIACAIQGGADIFFTTDNSIIKKREKINKIRILNPVYLFTDSEYTEE
jgi:predicted nucleic acid-binding protein